MHFQVAHCSKTQYLSKKSTIFESSENSENQQKLNFHAKNIYFDLQRENSNIFTLWNVIFNKDIFVDFFIWLYENGILWLIASHAPLIKWNEIAVKALFWHQKEKATKGNLL